MAHLSEKAYELREKYKQKNGKYPRGWYYEENETMEEYEGFLERKLSIGNESKYEFFIAGRARNKFNILKICDLFDKYKISYYCFLKNEDNWGYGNKNQTPEEKQKEFETLDLKSDLVLNLFHKDLDGEKNSNNLLLVLPAGKAAHIEAGIAYGLGKKCYAIGEYETTDTLYNIFEKIFSNEKELKEFLKEYFVEENK